MRKKLGFEGLFDATDPDVEDVDDVVGLCSGKFVTQAAATTPLSPAKQVPQVNVFRFLKGTVFLAHRVSVKCRVLGQNSSSFTSQFSFPSS